jgi:hypothetical protein
MPFYEPDTNEDRWAGGFASDGTHIEVIGRVDGHETAISTTPRQHQTSTGFERRIAGSELLWRYQMEDPEELTLPYTVTVEAEDRTIVLNNDTQTVEGMRVTGDDQWVGMIYIDDVTVKISTSCRNPIPLRVCIDPKSLPEFPPEPH